MPRPQTRPEPSGTVPKKTTPYRVAQEHLDTFLAFVDIETGGAGLPKFVTDEFDAFLDCDILAHGFLRLSCDC